MAIGFDFRDQVNNPDWTIARGALIDQLDRMLAAINASPGVTGSADPNSVLVADAAGAVGFTPLGSWTNAPFNANDYQIGGVGTGSWVVAPASGSTVSPIQYVVLGALMIVSLDISFSALTITASTGVITVAIPGGYRAANRFPASSTYPGHAWSNACRVLNNSSYPNARLVVNQNALTIDVTRDGTDFVSSTDLSVYGQIAFEIVPQ